ncbi:type II toxin-antitoxin system HipA family toxin [Oceanimonas smirnovii]|uniref:Type II toxin-antitoxin system HipA family toxin n=1 Tax=Oceanimonas smirnovii TaxID=264574 RepID=A0ABW7P2F9_9GAMM
MTFKPVQRLDVTRTLASGERLAVGVLAQNRQGIFFQYHQEYLRQYGNLSPFSLRPSAELQRAPREPHGGLHGVFADALPDGWGLLLQDRLFRQHGILPVQVTPLDRLAFVGSSGIGALSFAPASGYCPVADDTIDLHTLGREAQALFDGQTEQVLAALAAAGSSGGARPKAQVYARPEEPGRCTTLARPGDEAWLVKFSSRNLPLGHEEGQCEAIFLSLAKRARLEPPEWTLLPAAPGSGAEVWLAVKRFDWLANKTATAGRLHMHSACGLLDADFRAPSLDYEDLIKASRHLCKSPAVGRLQFRRALFNLFACNQDDHSKNWAFLQTDQGEWLPAPFYDVTFSPHPFGEHATAFVGHGNAPTLKAVQTLAMRAGFSSWPEARACILELLEVLAEFEPLAREYGLSRKTIGLISAQLKRVRDANAGLITI